jgi:hypothetical protein
MGGRHEVAKDLLVLQDCVSNAVNIKGVKIVTKYLAERATLNVDDLKGVDGLIIECSSVSSSQQRTHPLFPPLPRATRTYDQATLDYLSQVDALHKAGMGIMIIHWGIVVNNDNKAARDYCMSWFGQAARDGLTQNPMGFWKVTPIEKAKNHPILSGVSPWIYKDEMFSRLENASQDDPHRTDLLMGESPQTNQSEQGSPPGVIGPRCIASAYENGKERGILWGGMDFHSALLHENYLRFMLNAIVWTAGIDVPAGGVKTSLSGKQLQLAPINQSFENYKKPDGYVAPTLPE